MNTQVQDSGIDERKMLLAIDEVNACLLKNCRKNAQAFRALIKTELTMSEALQLVRRIRRAQKPKDGFEYTVMLDPDNNDHNFVLFRRVRSA
jgi:hypothetical protein